MSSHYVFYLIHHYGYMGLSGILVLGIVGLPLPDETLLTAVGYLVYRGHLSYFPAILAGIFGAGAGITVSYLIGRLFGRPMIIHYGKRIFLSERRLLAVETFFDRYGGVSLLIGLFIPGVRHITAIAAGLAKMDISRYAFFAYTGVCLWVITFITLGRFAGPHLTIIEQFVQQKFLLSIVLILGLGALIWGVKKVFKSV